MQPQSIEQNDANKYLVCLPVGRKYRELCGSICDADGIDVYEEFLAKPNRDMEQSRFDEPPFDIPKMTADDKRCIRVPVYLCKDSVKLLFMDLTVPDIISRLERGRCGLCEGGNIMCPGCTGGRASRFFGEYCGCGVCLCPLCIVMDVAGEHYRRVMRGETDGMPEDEFEEWYKERGNQLGYEYIPPS